VASIACGIEVLAAGLLEPFGVASAAGCLACGIAQSGHFRSLVLTQLASINIIPPAEWPAFHTPLLCCQVPQNRATASALALPIVRLY
jgi:hypothetical protein